MTEAAQRRDNPPQRHHSLFVVLLFLAGDVCFPGRLEPAIFLGALECIEGGQCVYSRRLGFKRLQGIL